MYVCTCHVVDLARKAGDEHHGPILNLSVLTHDERAPPAQTAKNRGHAMADKARRECHVQALPTITYQNAIVSDI